MKKGQKTGGNHGGEGPPIRAYLLAPLGLLFLQSTRLKAFLYRRAVKPIRLRRPVICVGNLTFGGTGKTPVTIALTRLLKGMGERPAVLLRGYGRSSHGSRVAAPDNPPQEVGDEALTLARNLPGVPVAVGERREEAAALVEDEATVFLLDDGFQHLRVHRDLDILLVDASRPGDLRAPPVGRLREPLPAARRADLLVVTRGGPEELPAALLSSWAGRPVVTARFEWEDDLLPEGSGTLSDWAGKKVLLFAGVGNGEAFLEAARRAGFGPDHALLFEDHAEADDSHRLAVREKLRASGCEAALTTEKDAVKWLPVWEGPAPLLYCRIATAFEDPEGNLQRLLAAALEKRG